MNFFEPIGAEDHEQVVLLQNRATGLRAILAIHDTTLGPALGGVRVWRYASDADALADALRLSRAMTYKASLAGLPCGGGKAVVQVRDEWERAGAMEALGRAVESLRGRFFCGRDAGVTDEDLEAIGRQTRYVAREPSPELGDISEHTAIGVRHGMRACLEFTGLRGAGGACRTRVAIQGAGSVGMLLARILKQEGMKLLVADIDSDRAEAAAKQLGAERVSPEEILTADCDVLAPCALGGVITRENAAKIRARIVCGSANNILESPEAGDMLAQRGIVYAPDYLVNAGGLIRGAEYYLMKRADSLPSLAKIYERTMQVLKAAGERNVSTARVADEWAESRIRRPKFFRDLCWGRAPA